MGGEIQERVSAKKYPLGEEKKASLYSDVF